MKVFSLNIVEESNGGRFSREELLFVFEYGDCSEYFAENDGEWDWVFWFTKSNLFATADFDCWCERMVFAIDVLPFKRKSSLCESVEDAMEDMDDGEHYICTIRNCLSSVSVEVKCLYCGSVENCPGQYKFDLVQSEAEI